MHSTDADLNADERRREIAAIIAHGVLRPHGRAAAPSRHQPAGALTFFTSGATMRSWPEGRAEPDGRTGYGVLC